MKNFVLLIKNRLRVVDVRLMTVTGIDADALEVLPHSFDELKTAHSYLEQLRTHYGLIAIKRNGNKKRVQCVDDGRVFESAAAAARAYAINASNLSAHLNNTVGYPTVQGLRFIRIDNED